MEAATAMPRGLALWEITQAERELAERLEANGGELTPELEAVWESLQGSFDAKAERIALYVRELTANAAGAKEEAERLDAIYRAYANRAKHLKGYLLHQMERSGRNKVETSKARMWVQRNGGKPSIYWSGTPDTIPTHFRRTVVTLDGQAAQDAYEDGMLPEGFVVTPVGVHLRIS